MAILGRAGVRPSSHAIPGGSHLPAASEGPANLITPANIRVVYGCPHTVPGVGQGSAWYGATRKPPGEKEDFPGVT